MKTFRLLLVLLAFIGQFSQTTLAFQPAEQNVTYPILSVNPSKFDFSAQLGFPAQVDFTIRNIGVSVLKIKSIEISGDPFSLIDPNSYPFEVVADSGFAFPVGNNGKTLKFSVRFSPLEVGINTGKVIITYGLYSDQILEIPLTGDGMSCENATVATKGENHLAKLNSWVKYTADKFSIVEVNSCHPNQVNPLSNPYRLIPFYVYYYGCNGPFTSEVEEYTGFCPYDHQAIPVETIMKAGETIYIFWPKIEADSPFNTNGIYFNINVTYPIDGDVCETAIPLTLPVVNLFGNTRGLQDDYNISPCSPFTNFMDGNDIVYTITLPAQGYLTGNILGAYASVHVLDVCPTEELPKTSCKAFAGGPNGGQFRKKMDAGTYFVIISNWAPPQTVDYLLTLSWEGVSAVENEPLETNLIVYPNPATNMFTVGFNRDEVTDVTIELINTPGQIVYRKELKSVQSFRHDIDVSQLSKGVYYLKVVNSKELMIRKILVD